ncbi:MAG: hypothetical protein WCJ37_03555 [Syntrophus sp. (in: bacteria)]
MKTEEKIKRLEDRIDQLEKRIAYLEGKREKAAKNGKPVNMIAFEKAIDDSMHGVRNALEKYGEHYSYPT